MNVDLDLDLDALGAAVVVDAEGKRLHANEGGEAWLAFATGSALGHEHATKFRHTAGSRWVERPNADGSTTRALMTTLPRRGGGSLMLFDETPIDTGQADLPVRALLDSIPAMIGYWDRDRRNRFANRAYVEWFGMTPQQMHGLHILELLGPDIYQQNLRFIEAALRGEPQHFERAIPRPRGGGVRHSSAIYVPDVRGGETMGFSVLVFDVTELKNAEAALKDAQQELERRVRERTAELELANAELARSNAELAQFAHIASHDLQEPLRTLATYSELLRERYQGQLDERGDRYIGYIMSAATRMLALVVSLLEMSRVGAEPRPLVPSDSNHALQVALQALGARTAQSAAQIDVEPLPRVLADVSAIAKVFENLICNALKFTVNGPPSIRVSARRMGDFVEFSVTDNGIGVDMEFSDKIFKMLQRVHGSREFEGSGMGLAITKKIIDGHGGTVGVRSILGQGATFWFTLKAADE